MNMKRLTAALFLVLMPVTASAAEVSAEQVAKRVGQVFAGYNDLWVWVVQRLREPDGKETESDGRVYFKRDKMFRLNFGQPPFLVHGTDGDEYWVYDKKANVIRHRRLDKDTAVHPLLLVFSAGDQMVRALDRFFNVDSLEEAKIDEGKTPAYKLILSLKPEKVKEMREKAGNKLATDEAKQTWTFWIDKKESLPRKIQIDWETKRRYIFELGKRLGKQHANKRYKFYSNRGLSEKLFQMPNPPGVRKVKMEESE